MKITYNNTTIDFFEFELPNQVLLSLSGGADSAAIAYLICTHFPQIEIVPFTARDENAPLDAVAAEKIVSWLQKEFPNCNIRDTNIYNFNDRVEKYVSWKTVNQTRKRNKRFKLLNNVQLSKIIQLDKIKEKLNQKFPNAVSVDGMTKNPPVEIMKELGFYEKAERRRDYETAQPEHYQTKYNYHYQPFVNVDKKFVAGVYKENNLMETLFLLTRSCVGTARQTDNFTRECHQCFWCHEKKWAFELNWEDKV